MKQYNFDNLKSDEHVFHMWEPLNFKIKDDYEYVCNSFIFNLISNIIYFPVALIVIILDKILFGFKIEDEFNVLRDTGFVSISNHVHVMDSTMIALVYFPNRVYFPTIQNNFKIPFIRHLIRILYAMPIPDKKNQKERFYNQINGALKKNKIVQMYPEGSMWPYYDEIRNFKYGAFKMAVDANKPIQPIKFVYRKPKGLYKLYKKKDCITAVVLKPVYPNNKLNRRDRIDDLRKRVINVMKETIE